MGSRAGAVGPGRELALLGVVGARDASGPTTQMPMAPPQTAGLVGRRGARRALSVAGASPATVEPVPLDPEKRAINRALRPRDACWGPAVGTSCARPASSAGSRAFPRRPDRGYPEAWLRASPAGAAVLGLARPAPSSSGASKANALRRWFGGERHRVSPRSLTSLARTTPSTRRVGRSSGRSSLRQPCRAAVSVRSRAGPLERLQLRRAAGASASLPASGRDLRPRGQLA